MRLALPDKITLLKQAVTYLSSTNKNKNITHNHTHKKKKPRETNFLLNEIRMLLKVGSAIFIRSTFNKASNLLNSSFVKFSTHSR